MHRCNLLILLTAVAAVGDAAAATISLDQSQLLQSDPLFSDQTNPINGLFVSTAASGGGVEFEVPLKADVAGSTATVGIGLDNSTTDLASLGLADLSGFESFALSFQNVNDDIWSVSLFLTTEDGSGQPTIYVTSPAASFAPLASVDLALDFAALGVANLDRVTQIGFRIQGKMTGVGGHPSNGDISHILVQPALTIAVPEPNTLLLGCLGGLGLLWGVHRTGRLKTTSGG
jgi:hypothetical protein